MPATLYALLGSHPTLSLAELQTLDPKAELITEHLARFSLDETYDAQAVQDRLGGTVKLLTATDHIFKKIPTADEIATILSENQEPGTKIQFGIVHINEEAPDLTAIKKALKKQGYPARYRQSKAPFGLSAAVLQHEVITELYVIALENQYHTFKTVASQNIDEWSHRDRGRPHGDRKQGMLPLKVARLMINLAITPNQANNSESYLYDPFCGAGSVLSEAYYLGIKAVGSDQQRAAVMGSQTNLTWLQQEYPELGPLPYIFQKEVTQVKPDSIPGKVTAIVTEPFLGKQTPRDEELKDVFKGLYKLYKGAFKTWAKLLRKGGRVVIVFPIVETERQQHDLSELIDELPSLGYNTVSGPLMYARPEARVKRAIYIFEKSTT